YAREPPRAAGRMPNSALSPSPLQRRNQPRSGLHGLAALAQWRKVPNLLRCRPFWAFCGPIRGGRPMFETLKPAAPDGILALMSLYRDDPRAGKIDLGVGVYRDESGGTPVMRAVREA